MTFNSTEVPECVPSIEGAPPEDDFWTANVAVLEEMSATMQPQWFGPGMENTLTISLKATQAGSRNGKGRKEEFLYISKIYS